MECVNIKQYDIKVRTRCKCNSHLRLGIQVSDCFCQFNLNAVRLHRVSILISRTLFLVGNKSGKELFFG